MITGFLHPDLARQEESQRCLSRIYEYCVLQIDQEEQQVEKRRRLSEQTYKAIKKKDAGVIDLLKKRRGRKRFILIDQKAKDSLSKQHAQQLAKLRHGSVDKGQRGADEDRLVQELRLKIERVSKREEKVINKERMLRLSEGRDKARDRKRRRTTHFTSSKHKNKPSLPLRKGLVGRKAKGLAKKSAARRKQTGFSDGSQLGFGDAPVRIEKVRVSS